MLALTESFAGRTAGVRPARPHIFALVLPPPSGAQLQGQDRLLRAGRGGRGEERERGPDLSVHGGRLGALLEPLRGPKPRVVASTPPPIKLTAYDDGVPVASASLLGASGETATASLAADRMDRLEIEGGSAALIDLCFVPVEQGLADGWQIIPTFPYPMCLPSAATAIRARAGRPATRLPKASRSGASATARRGPGRSSRPAEGPRRSPSCAAWSAI